MLLVPRLHGSVPCAAKLPARCSFFDGSGGECNRVARILVLSIPQPRLIFQAQFQHLTLRDWDRLETVSREAMRVITGLPGMTPIPTLQAEAQLNTLDALVDQRQRACHLKIQTVPAAAALAHYFDASTPVPTATIS